MTGEYNNWTEEVEALIKCIDGGYCTAGEMYALARKMAATLDKSRAAPDKEGA